MEFTCFSVHLNNYCSCCFSIKSRGGMGVNLAFGIVIAMIYVFFDKVFGVMAEQSDFSPLLAVWFPNILFGQFSNLPCCIMLSVKLKNSFTLHFLVLIAGFTAVF